MNIKELTNKSTMATYARSIALKKGKGSIVVDECGKKYIDFTGGIAVNTFGFCDKKWVKTIVKQAKTLSHTSNLFYTSPSANLANQLATRAGMDKVFLCNSGCEANECAIKAVRKHSNNKYGAERSNIITLKNSFHGRSLATLSATGQPQMHTPFLPMLQGFSFAEVNNFESVQKLVNNKTAGVILELVQGESGVTVLDIEFVKAVAKLCSEKDVMLVIDEVQTGIGRTGSLFAFEKYGIKPDLVTLAKGLGGGLPIGACIFAKTISNVFAFGDHGSTFGGNPIACAGASSVLNRIDAEFLNQVIAKGEMLKSELLKCPKVKAVSGAGLMLGIEVDGDAKSFVAEACNRGLLILTAKNKLRLLPPLNISNKDLNNGLAILKEILK